MKKTLEKLRQSPIAKLIIAAIVPGGFIIWGLYELSKSKRDKNSTKETVGENENSEST